MASSSQAAVVIKRVLDDDYIHAQIVDAGAGVRDAYRRARRLPPQKAIQDKTVYDRMRQAAGGLTEATRRALGKPEPKPPRGRRALIALVLLTTGAVVVWATRSHSRGQDDVSLQDTSRESTATPAGSTAW